MKKNIDLVIDGIAPEKVMYDTDNHSLVVLYPAQEEFKRGDILASDDALLIFDEYANEEKNKLHSLWNNKGISNINWLTKYFKHATDEQIAQLHEELKEDGKRWNAETLQVEDLDVNGTVYNLSSACSYLNKPIPDFSSLLLTISSEDFHKYKAQITLQLIREAWNKFDGFVPDLEDAKQYKYSPYCDTISNAINVANTADWLGFEGLIVFKTPERALQFGKQFKELLKTAMGL